MDVNLGPLEIRVLGLLDAEQPKSIAEIQHKLEQEGAPLAYTTVMTVLSRLFEKGLVSREKDGRRFAYRTSSRASETKTGLLTRMGQALFRRDRVRPILTLVDQSGLTAAELKGLRDMLDSRLKGKSS